MNSTVMCRYCNTEQHRKVMSLHLKTYHNVNFKQYILDNRDLYPNYHDCEMCKINITKGKTCSIKCRSIRQSLIQKGRIGWSKGLTKETHSGLKRMAEKAKLRTGINIWERMSVETRLLAAKKISVHTTKRVQGTNNPMYGKKHTTEAVRKIFKHRKVSSLEQKLIDFLNKNNIEYYFQFFIGDISKYSYDFKIKNKNLLIELDGDYWHGGPGLKKYHDNVHETKMRDKEKEDYAIARGFTILRFWESEIKQNQDIIFNKILQEINQ